MTVFAFLDVETTGLDPEANCILEVAWILTDKYFEPLSDPKSFIVDLKEDTNYAFAQIDNSTFLTDMHTQSGLLAALRDPATVKTPMPDILDAFETSIWDVNGHGDMVRFAGYSVSFDREFLRFNGWRKLLETRELSFQMHHRILDVSSNIQLFEAAEVKPPTAPNLNPHRALDDALNTLDVAQQMRDMIRATWTPSE